MRLSACHTFHHGRLGRLRVNADFTPIAFVSSLIFHRQPQRLLFLFSLILHFAKKAPLHLPGCLFSFAFAYGYIYWRFAKRVFIAVDNTASPPHRQTSRFKPPFHAPLDNATQFPRSSLPLVSLFIIALMIRCFYIAILLTPLRSLSARLFSHRYGAVSTRRCSAHAAVSIWRFRVAGRDDIHIILSIAIFILVCSLSLDYGEVASLPFSR